jgi:hypothetical protein
MAASSAEGTRKVWQHMKFFTAGEMKESKPLVVWTGDAAAVMTRSKPVRRLEDMKGMKIRTPSSAQSEQLIALGATPFGEPFDVPGMGRDAVLAETRRHRADLAEVEAALESGDREWLEGFFGSAAEGRQRLLAQEDTVGGDVVRLTVAVPNRPGVLSEIATALGHAHINIADLHLSPARADEPSGTLSLDIAGDIAVARAVDLIREKGFRVS